jgi:hypothetical protein
MITDSFIRELEEIVGKQNVSVSRANAELYSYDASLARGKPGVVVFPAGKSPGWCRRLTNPAYPSCRADLEPIYQAAPL